MTIATPSAKPKGTLKRWAIHRGIESAARIGRMLGSGRRFLARCEVTRDVAYGPLAEQRLDVYRPAGASGMLPVLLYVHGGGFSFCSKETHWSFASRYALMGFVVFNIDYRLAPTHKFPAAFDDAARALAWVREQAPKYGGDPSRIVIAGESAGGNLTASLVAASCYKLSHPSAAALFESAPPIVAALPACGVLQVTDMARFKRRKESLPDWIAAQLETMEHSYLGNRFMHAVEWLLSPEGYFHKCAIVWAGDYADPEGEDGVEPEVDKDNLHHKCNELDDREILPDPKHFNPDDYPYLVNHTRKEFVMKVSRGSFTPHPLSILTAEGNGAGGGDYRGKNDAEAGRWARELISVEKEIPEGYSELDLEFEE